VSVVVAQDPHAAAPSSPILPLPSVQQHPPTCYQIYTSSMVRSADPCGLHASVDQPALVARERDRTGFDASAWHADSAACACDHAIRRAPACIRYMPTRTAIHCLPQLVLRVDASVLVPHIIGRVVATVCLLRHSSLHARVGCLDARATIDSFMNRLSSRTCMIVDVGSYRTYTVVRSPVYTGTSVESVDSAW
jgi:hypothetical protein